MGDKMPAVAVPGSARQRILDAALELFYRDGVRATGIDRIIATSGVAKMSFYRHFPSKSDLICAFLEERHWRWLDWFETAISAKISAGAGRLEAVGEALADWFAEPGFRGCAFINTMAEIGNPASREHQICVAHKQELERRLTALAAMDGAADPEKAGRLALLIVEGAIIRAQLTGSAEPALDAKALLGRLVA